jgi:hypothetical protein
VRLPTATLLDVSRRLRSERHGAELLDTLRPQALLRYRCLGSDAWYRTISVRDLDVDLEVVSAPGLVSGTPMRVTKFAACRMTRVPWPREFLSSVSRSRYGAIRFT